MPKLNTRNCSVYFPWCMWKNHQFLSGIKNMHTKEDWFFFLPHGVFTMLDWTTLAREHSAPDSDVWLAADALLGVSARPGWTLLARGQERIFYRSYLDTPRHAPGRYSQPYSPGGTGDAASGYLSAVHKLHHVASLTRGGAMILKVGDTTFPNVGRTSKQIAISIECTEICCLVVAFINTS